MTIATRNSSALLLIAMTKHGIAREQIAERVTQQDRDTTAPAARSLVNLFADGGPCEVTVAAALISLIAERKR